MTGWIRNMSIKLPYIIHAVFSFVGGTVGVIDGKEITVNHAPRVASGIITLIERIIYGALYTY